MEWVCYLFAAAAIAALSLWLAAAAEFALALRVGAQGRQRPGAAVIAIGAREPRHLVRRTVPRLRAHRPTEVIEAQRRWRAAAEAHSGMLRADPAPAAGRLRPRPRS